MKRSISLLLLILLMNFPMSCLDDCGQDVPSRFSIEELDLKIGSVVDNTFSGDVSTSFQRAAIQVNIAEVDFFASADEYFHNPFLQAAYACSPVPPILNEEITSIQVTSDKELMVDATTYGAGESLNDVFFVSTSGYGDLSVDEFIELTESTSFFYYSDELFLLMLESAPDSAVDQEITISISFNNGDDFILKTSDFKVNP